MEFIFFWKPDKGNYGWLSNWYISDFIVKNIKYTSVEQYIMSSKASLFNDKNIEQKIMSTADPNKQRSLGRKVKNFDNSIWDKNKEKILYTALQAKFTQDIELKKKLLSTKNKTLVEASPFDRIYGIGLSETNPKALDKKTWRGQNLLGKTLMKVRKIIIIESIKI
jgi:ribA/ribD-fused uncharacterized protein